MSFEASKSLLFVATLVLATLVSGQRSSPQFSFPPPGSLASQFGSDVFSSQTGQDFGLLQQAGQPNLAVPETPQVNSAVLGAEQLPSQHHQLIAQSVDSQQHQHQQQQQQPQQQQHQQQQQPQHSQHQHHAHQHQQAPQVVAVAQPVQPAVQQSARQQEPASLQVSRVSQPSASQQSARSSQAQATAFVPVAAPVAAPAVTAAASVASERQPARHRSSQSQSQSQSAPSQQPQQHQHNHRERSSHNPSNNNNLQTQQTSQSLTGSTSQAAIDTARRAEATAASLAAGSSQNYQCPDSFGYFRHHKSCDKYWACENGTSTLKLCGNGLMFDDSDPKRENCAYPFSVDCGSDRTDLEPPISTPHCPRLYGLFADSANCRVFYSCWNGESSKYECPPGLAYDNEQRVCVWADLVDRCDQSEVSDGFVCPDPTEVDQPGHYTRHAHPTDCRKFYVCIEGVARPYGCSLGTVFNVDSLQCDEPENVSGCEKYYGDLDPKLAKKLAVLGVEKEQPKATNQGPTERGSTPASARTAASQAN